MPISTVLPSTVFAGPVSVPDRQGPAGVPTHSARDLTGADDTARLVLDGQVYVLRITRAGKLILTK